MTPNLDELDALAKGCDIDGAWEMERVSLDDGSFSYEINNEHRFISVSEWSYSRNLAQARRDAKYIAAMKPKTTLALIARIRELEQMCNQKPGYPTLGSTEQ